MVDAGGFRPFVVAQSPNGGAHRITVADCPHPADALFQHQRAANARLIAAAPDLLAALKAMIDPAYGNPSMPIETRRIEAQAEAAIAKAEGR